MRGKMATDTQLQCLFEGRRELFIAICPHEKRGLAVWYEIFV